MTNVAYADLIFLKWSVDNISETLQIIYWFLEIRNKSSCHISDRSFTKDDLDIQPTFVLPQPLQCGFYIYLRYGSHAVPQAQLVVLEPLGCNLNMYSYLSFSHCVSLL